MRKNIRIRVKGGLREKKLRGKEESVRKQRERKGIQCEKTDGRVRGRGVNGEKRRKEGSEHSARKEEKEIRIMQQCNRD